MLAFYLCQQNYVSRFTNAMTVMCKLELREEEEVRVRRFADDAGDPAAARASFIVKLATVLKQIVETFVPQESSTIGYHVPPLQKQFSKTAE